MKGNYSQKSTRLLSSFLAIMMLFCSLGTTAMAAEVQTNDKISSTIEEITPRAGTETLPYGWYDIGSFTFSGGGNLTPVKTVKGRYLTLGVAFRKSSKDGYGNNINLTIKIKDYSTGSIINTYDCGNFNDDIDSRYVQYKVDMGRTGRKVQIWFILTTPGVSGGPSRTVDILTFKSYVE